MRQTGKNKEAEKLKQHLTSLDPDVWPDVNRDSANRGQDFTFFDWQEKKATKINTARACPLFLHMLDLLDHPSLQQCILFIDSGQLC